MWIRNSAGALLNLDHIAKIAPRGYSKDGVRHVDVVAITAYLTAPHHQLALFDRFTGEGADDKAQALVDRIGVIVEAQKDH